MSIDISRIVEEEIAKETAELRKQLDTERAAREAAEAKLRGTALFKEYDALRERFDVVWKELAGLRRQFQLDTGNIERIRAQGERDAAMLEVAKTALEHITGCEAASDVEEGKIIYAILRAKTALSQINGDQNELHQKCPRCGNAIDPDVCWCGDPMNGGHEGHNPIPMGCDYGRDTTQVPLAKEQHEPRTRTLLRSMLDAFDRNDCDTYWVTFGMLLEVHKEMTSADVKGTKL